MTLIEINNKINALSEEIDNLQLEREKILIGDADFVGKYLYIRYNG